MIHFYHVSCCCCSTSKWVLISSFIWLDSSRSVFHVQIELLDGQFHFLVIFNCELIISRIKLYWKDKFSENSGKGMLRNPYGRVIRNRLLRKLYYRYQTGVSISLTSRCRRSMRVAVSFSGSNLSSVHPKRSGQDSLARYTSGRSDSFPLRIVICLFS